MMKRGVLAILLLAAGTNVALAQANKYGETPEQQKKCKEKISLYREFRDQKNYDQAFEPWKQACEICPKAAKTLYTDGVKFYTYQFEKATRPSHKDSLVEAIKATYDARIANFGSKGKYLGKKGADMFELQPEKPFEAYQVMKEAVALTKEKTSPTVLYAYYYAMFEAMKLEKVEKADVLGEYLSVSEYLDKGKLQADGKYAKNYEIAKTNIDGIFILIANCEDIEAIAVTKFEAAPDDLDNLKKLSQILAKRECTDADIFAKVAKALFDKEPSHEGAYALSIATLKKGKYSESLTFAKQALEMNQQPSEDYYLVAATAAIGSGQASLAASYARKAIGLNPNSGKAYLIIGDAIASSAGKCGGNEVEQGAVYWLAVDYYVKAKSLDSSVAAAANQKIGAYRARFPDKKVLFQYSYIDGNGNVKKDPVTVGCWINEKVVPRL